MESLPRAANRAELDQLLAYRLDCGEEEDTALSVVQSASIAVFPNYQTGCPGYVGQVMVVIYDTAPDAVETYLWHQGRMIRA